MSRLKDLTQMCVEDASVEIQKNSSYFNTLSPVYVEANNKCYFPCRDGLVEVKYVLIDCGSFQDNYVEIVDIYRAFDTDVLEDEISRLKKEADRKINEMLVLKKILENKQEI